MKSCKISIFGSGGTGYALAQALATRDYVDIVLIDIDIDTATGKAIDLGQAGALLHRDVQVRASQDVEETRDSDVVVMTAGLGRKPGMQREELLRENGRLIAQFACQTADLSPQAVIIVLTNPADLLARVAFEESGFPAHRVLGQGGILDSARMATFVSQTLGVSVRDVRAMVLGGHGDSMVPVREFVSVHGVPASHMITDEEWRTVVHRTRFGGGEILGKFKTHGAAVTPGYAVLEMIDALLSPRPHLLPVSVQGDGSYGITGTFIGLPALISNRGVERIVKLPLNVVAQAALVASARQLESAWSIWQSVTSSSQSTGVASTTTAIP